MKTVKVGDKVRVVGNNSGHGFEVGSVVTLTEAHGDLIRATDGIVKWYISCDEYEPIATNRIVVGGEYTSHNFNKYKCIFVDGDYAWLAPAGRKAAAYVFKTDGTNISQGGGEWNINFEPVVETVNVKGSISETFQPGSFFNMTVGFIDGKPDWSTAKVTPA